MGKKGLGGLIGVATYIVEVTNELSTAGTHLYTALNELLYQFMWIYQLCSYRCGNFVQLAEVMFVANG